MSSLVCRSQLSRNLTELKRGQRPPACKSIPGWMVDVALLSQAHCTRRSKRYPWPSKRSQKSISSASGFRRYGLQRINKILSLLSKCMARIMVTSSRDCHPKQSSRFATTGWTITTSCLWKSLHAKHTSLRNPIIMRNKKANIPVRKIVKWTRRIA